MSFSFALLLVVLAKLCFRKACTSSCALLESHQNHRQYLQYRYWSRQSPAVRVTIDGYAHGRHRQDANDDSNPYSSLCSSPLPELEDLIHQNQAWCGDSNRHNVVPTLKHQLSQLGFPVEGKDSRFRVVPESWTSILCWKCGKKGSRPTQNHFVCPTCGHRTNADRNGSINIAGRLITLTKSLHSVRGLGKWASAIARSTRPKTRGKKLKSSRGKFLLPSKGEKSNLGESAVVHRTQLSLLDFSDGIKMDDNDPAVESTVETLSVVGSDSPTSRQRKETRSTGGISS